MLRLVSECLKPLVARVSGGRLYKKPLRRLWSAACRGALLLYVLWVAHVGGALKHQFDGNPVLWRMLPFGKPKTPQTAVNS